MRVEPYLYFDGRCDQAIEFYGRAVGAEITVILRFKDAPDAQPRPGNENKVMHVALRIGESTVLASDGQWRGSPRFEGFSLSIAAASDGEAERVFAALSEGGRVQVQMMPTGFASRFGMVSDRFGVLWTIVAQQGAAAKA